MEVKLNGPYNFDLALRRIQANPLMNVDLNKRLIKLPLTVGGARLVVSVQALGTTETPSFQVSDNVKDKPDFLKRLKEILMWEVDLKQIADHFLDTDLSFLFQKYLGLPLILDVDLYRCLVTQIIHQQLNMTFAYRLTERFAKTYGSEREGVWFFPNPARVAQLNPEDLKALQFSTRKAEYIIGVSKAIVEGALDLDQFPSLSDEEVTQQLTVLRGVGHWTAQCVLLFGLGRGDLFLPADVGIQNGLKKVYQLNEKPTYEEMEKWSNPWSPYRSYASLYLWENLSERE